MGRWYCVEFYVRVASSEGTLSMWVNGAQILSQTNQNTAPLGNISAVRTGLVFVNGVTSNLVVYGDNYELSNTYIGLS